MEQKFFLQDYLVFIPAIKLKKLLAQLRYIHENLMEFQNKIWTI